MQSVGTLEKLKVTELRQKAAILGISYSKIRTKSELIKAIKAAESEAIKTTKSAALTTTEKALSAAVKKQDPPGQKELPAADYLRPSAAITIMDSNNNFDCIIHLADVHLPLENKYSFYNSAFTKNIILETINKALIQNKKSKPIIIIVGDLFDHRNRIYPHTLHLFDKLISMLSDVGPVVITAGNHDLVERNPDIHIDDENTHIDVISASLSRQKWPNVYYLSESGFYIFGNITIGLNSLFTVAKTGGQFLVPISKYSTDIIPASSNCINVGLWHGIIQGGDVGSIINDFGFELNSTKKRGVPMAADFDGYDMILLGDIHKRQAFKCGKVIAAYPGSTIQQNHGESINGHGFLLWDTFEKKILAEYDFPAPHAFVTINLDAAVVIPTIPSHITNIDLRIIGSVNNIENEVEKISAALKERVKILSCNVINIFDNFTNSVNINNLNKAEVETVNSSYLVENPITIGFEKIAAESEEITKKFGGGKEFSEFLKSVGNSDSGTDPLDISAPNSNSFVINKLSFNNLYGFTTADDNGFNIDFSQLQGKIIGIDGGNAAGKSNIISIIFKALFESDGRERLSNKHIINSTAEVEKKKMISTIEFNIHDRKYLIERTAKFHGKSSLTGETKLLEDNNNKMLVLSAGTKIETDKKIEELIGSSEVFLLLSVLGSGFGPHGTVFGIGNNTFSEAITSLFQIEFIKDRIHKRLNTFIKKIEQSEKVKKETENVIFKDSMVKLAASSQFKFDETKFEAECGRFYDSFTKSKNNLNDKRESLAAEIETLSVKLVAAEELYQKSFIEESKLAEKVNAASITSSAADIFKKVSSGELTKENVINEIKKTQEDIEINTNIISECNAKSDVLITNNEMNAAEKILILTKLFNKINSLSIEKINNIDNIDNINKFTPKRVKSIREKLEEREKVSAELEILNNNFNSKKDIFESTKMAFKRDFRVSFAEAQKNIVEAAEINNTSSAEEIKELQMRKYIINNEIAAAKMKIKNSVFNCNDDIYNEKEKVYEEKNENDRKIQSISYYGDINSCRKKLDNLLSELEDAKKEEESLSHLISDLEKQPDYDKDRKIVFKNLIGKIVTAVSGNKTNTVNTTLLNNKYKNFRSPAAIQKDVDAARIDLQNAEEYNKLSQKAKELEQKIIFIEMKEKSAELENDILPKLKNFAIEDLITRRNEIKIIGEKICDLEDKELKINEFLLAVIDKENVYGIPAVIKALEQRGRSQTKIEELKTKLNIYLNINSHIEILNNWKNSSIILNEKKKELDSINRKNKILKEDLAAAGIELEKIKHKIKEYKNIKKNIDVNTAEIEKVIEKIDKYKLASSIVSNIPRIVLKNKISTLNKWANEFLNAISFPFEIKFSCDILELNKTTKNALPAVSYEILRKTSQDVKREISYNNCSGFERTILSLAGKYALSIAAGYVNKNILFIDEALDSADEERSKLFPLLFDKLSQVYRKVLIISHRTDIKRLYQQSIKISEEDKNKTKKIIIA